MLRVGAIALRNTSLNDPVMDFGILLTFRLGAADFGYALFLKGETCLARSFAEVITRTVHSLVFCSACFVEHIMPRH